MKKLIAICFSIIFVIYSFISFIEFDIDSNKAMLDGKIRVELDRYETAENLEQLIKNRFAQEDLSAMYQTVDKDGDKYIYTYYKMLGDTKEYMEVAKSGKDFLKPNPGECYSTMPLEGYSYKDMPIANFGRETIVFNWSEAVKRGLSIGSFFVPRDKADKAVEILKSIGFQKAKVIEGAFIDNEESTRFNALFFPVCVALLCVFLYVLLNSKQYALRRMEGYGSRHIIGQEWMTINKLVWCPFAVFLVISLIVAKIVFNNAAFWSFNEHFNIFLFCGILLVIVLAIITVVVMSDTDKNYIDYVKGKVPQNTAYVTTLVAKSVFLMSMIPALSISLRCVERDFDIYNRARTLEEEVARYVTAIPDHFKLDETGRHGINSLVTPFMDEKKDVFVQLYHKLSDEYNGILCQNGEWAEDGYSERVPDIHVNINYFTENSVFLEDGQQIKKEDLDKDRNYVLYPSNRSGKKQRYLEALKRSHKEDIFLIYDSNKSKICAYDVEKGGGPENLLKDPIVFVLGENSMLELITHKSDGKSYPWFAYYLCAKYFFFKAHTEDPVAEITPMLKEMFNWDFKVESLAKSFYDRTFNAKDLFLRSSINSLLFMAATLCFIFASAKLYCENHKKRISQALVDGFSLWRCIKTHILAIIATNVFIGLLLLASRPLGAADSADIRVIVACLVVDLIISLALCGRYARANLQKILKGADV